jgi:hypothetical protein
MTKQLVLGVLALALVGCGQIDSNNQSGKKKKSGGVGDAVDTVVIQKGKIQAGQKAADRVRAIGAQEQQDLNEVMGE